MLARELRPVHGPHASAVGETFDPFPCGEPVEASAPTPLVPTGVPETRKERHRMQALLLSFGVIFVAELGDKSQLMAMTFAVRYKFWTVLAGITVSTALVHLASVGIGRAVGVRLPTSLINIVAGVAFLAFAAWTLRGDELSNEEADKAQRVKRSAFLAVAVAFFLAELGDKTMLATITLATTEGWFGTWLGSTLGMVAADALAIGVGAVLGKRLPEKSVRIGAAALFVVFGALLIIEGVVR
ncbi:MAG: Ca2+/H+ antiporter, family [Actinomycetota bacterium]|jgi:putative Ca2+/H+ antiporter (TMEM165/GDT1 family)|nr:Ca2+/H+ antiporter, family [Actinomycetota bacterium]